jgi:hypothetical protein
MKGLSKTTHAGLGPLIPAVLAPPEAVAQAPQGFIPPPLHLSGARRPSHRRGVARARFACGAARSREKPSHGR